jgi:pilus assembly protein CpaD
MSSNRVLTAALLCLGLAACASVPDNPARQAKSAADLYPLHAEVRADKVALAIHAAGLSAAQTEALVDLAARWREGRGSQVVLDVPGKADPQAAALMRDAAAQVLESQGLSAADIRAQTYDALDPAAPLMISFSRVQAVTPQCGVGWDGLTHSADNNVQPNFGCAVSANMASQMANPSDIIHPRAEDMPNASRRTAMMTMFGANKPVGADDVGKSAVSKVVN